MVKIVIPVIIEKIDETDYTDPRATDLKSVDSKASIGVGINIPECKIEVGGNHFSGSYTNERWPFQKIYFRGHTSADGMMLQKLWIYKSYSNGDDSFLESETSNFTLFNLPISHSSLPVADGICKFDKDISSVEVYKYNYTKTSSSRNYNKSLTRTFKHVNNELLPGLEDIFRFRIKLSIDGPPSYMLYVEDLPQDDPDYSLFLSERQNGEIQVELNSVAIYNNYEGLDKSSTFKINQDINLLTMELLKASVKNVYARIKMDKIQQEAELSELGLTTEEGKVRSNRLLKEEVALLVKIDLPNKNIEYKILSKKGAKIVSVYNVTEEHYSCAYTKARNEARNITLKFLDKW
jgi:hypothetical protein